MLRKILLAFIAVDMVLVAVAVLVYSSLNGLKHEINHSANVVQPFRQAATSASSDVLGVSRLIGGSFLASNEDQINALRQQTNVTLNRLSQVLKELQSDRFAQLLAAAIDTQTENEQAEGTAQENEAGEAEGASQQADASQTVGDLIAEIVEENRKFQSSAVRAMDLAVDTLKMVKQEQKLKINLSKKFRKTLSLESANPKKFGQMARGVIVLMYTKSIREAMNVAGPRFTTGYKAMLKHCQENDLGDMTKRLEALKETYDQTYTLVRKRLGSGSDYSVLNAQAQRIATNINRLDVMATRWSEQAATSAYENAEQTITNLIALTVAGSFLSLGLGIVIARRISKPVVEMVRCLQTITRHPGQFDLTQRIDVKAKDEIALLGTWLGDFMVKVHDTIVSVGDAAQGVSKSAIEIASSSEDIARSMGDQSREVMQVSSAIEQMSASVVEVARKSTDAAGNANEAGTIAEGGGEIVQQVIDGMSSINEAVSTGAKAVTELGKRSTEIGQIIKVINDIADQTNLLALNAAIEAARAGEHGRGFAVVADEVRKLADRTTGATAEISDSIKAIQTDTAQAVERMSSGTERVEAGMVSATEAGERLQQIVQSAKQVAAMIESIAAAAEQQSAASEEVSRAINTINTITQNVSLGGSNSAANSVSGLIQRSSELGASLSRFKLNVDITGDAAKWTRSDEGPVRILIVDDDPAIQELIKNHLKERGECTVAGGGKQAISEFRSLLDQGSCFDLVCLDIAMPDMDGRTALDEIRNLEKEYGLGYRQRSKVAMITALDQAQDKLKAYKSSCDAYINKPIEKSQLLEAIESLGVRQPSPEQHSEAA